MSGPYMKLEKDISSEISPMQQFLFESTETVDTLQRNVNLVETAPTYSSTEMYCLKNLPEQLPVSGSANLLAYFGLETTYNKFCGGKKVKELLSSFLPDLPGYIDTVGMQDNSTLRALIERPPLLGSKEIQPLSPSLLSSFRLHPGPLPAQYRVFYQSIDTSRRKSKHKKHRTDAAHDPRHNDGEDIEHRKHKKKKHEDNEKKKKKREKKKKKERDKEKN